VGEIGYLSKYNVNGFQNVQTRTQIFVFITRTEPNKWTFEVGGGHAIETLGMVDKVKELTYIKHV
jgi:hypothetical protein